MLALPLRSVIALASLALASCAASTAGTAASAPPRPDPAASPLPTTIAALDTAVFDAFNRCSDPAQLQRHASYFAPEVIALSADSASGAAVRAADSYRTAASTRPHRHHKCI